MLKVQQKQYSTCIYHKDSPLNIKHLEAQIKDPRMKDRFDGHRICHHSKTAICNGFWTRHKDHFQLGQIAQRLKCVEFVNDDIFRKEDK